ncbi:protein phosphatase 3 catalytic subunit alpha-like [Paramacrobiotus metropolitanus]|uniref:protein phosphatase 3 catalytic subunit alpha-like n=1 Tax=Paramacrobiotus metropolitanus TaxID=2943436 RepID=UPI002445B7F7|nr:protein phosphatase 3 catalytic subunit alpha-like [Paramacrobiotus metropolitanus]
MSDNAGITKHRLVRITHFDTPPLLGNKSIHPTGKKLTIPEVYGDAAVPNPDLIKTHFFTEDRLDEALALRLIHDASEILRAEPNVLTLPSDITVAGDIHGQFYDLLTILRTGGPHFLFLGDYVDRGSFGIECILYLFALKISSPTLHFLLRGNHESRHLTEYFSFKRECVVKYSESVYDACMNAFDTLPLAAVINEQFLCIHAGLSPELRLVDDLNNLQRFKEISSDGLMCDILWSDPVPEFGHELAPYFYSHNRARGCSYNYSYYAVEEFLRRNKLLGIIRGHEVQNAGFKVYKSKQADSYPLLISIFSAPQYLDVYNNKAAVLNYANGKIHIRQFNSAEHPFWLPNFTDAFTWSYPYIVKKVREIILVILSICSEEELEESDQASRRRRAVERRKRVFSLKMRAMEKFIEHCKGLEHNLPHKDFLTLDYFPSLADDALFDKIEVIDANASQKAESVLVKTKSLPADLRLLDTSRSSNEPGTAAIIQPSKSLVNFLTGDAGDAEESRS